MLFFNPLHERRRQPEIMDDPALEPARHMQALAGLARINWLSGSARILWGPVRRLAQTAQGQPLRLLDVATGGGDVPLSLWRRARRGGLKLEISGADISPTALGVARRNAQAAKADVNFIHLDVARDGVPQGYDILTCSLFLHHLEREPARGFLGRLGQAARRLVLVNDLRRCRAGFLLAWAGARLLTTSGVVHADAPSSVAAAFTVEEVRALARDAGLAGATISRRWPCRYLLEWRRA